jgi:N utilization substance protein B
MAGSRTPARRLAVQALYQWQLAELDDLLAPLLERPLAQVDPVERAVLRVGAFELAHRPEVPYRVVINEAVELAKRFGAEQGHRFVNSVLDRLARDLRAVERKAPGKAT